nr:hypothetical protein [Tanacetum cinerariifolium]
MNYIEEQTDREAMINSIKNGDQPFPSVTQVSIAGTISTKQPPLKDKSMWSDQEKIYATMMRQNKNLMDINIDALYHILKQNQGDVNDAMGFKKKPIVEGHFAKDCKKAKVKDYEYYKTKMLLAKKDKDEQVLLAEDQAWMESSSDSDQEINANMVFMAQIKKVFLDSEASSLSADEKISE